MTARKAKRPRKKKSRMSLKATVVPPPVTENTINLEGITIAQGELMMACLRSFHSNGLLSATNDAKALEDALESAGISRKGRLPKPGRSGPTRKYYVASKSDHSFVMRSVTDPSATDESVTDPSATDDYGDA